LAFLPACGSFGAQGLPTPPPLDLTRLVRPASPNTALAAPADFRSPPDLVTQTYPLPVARLYTLVTATAGRQARTYPAAEYPDRWQAHYVARSLVFNFPDLITVQVTPDGTDSSRLVLYSRSVYGYSDLGANRTRLAAWLASLQSALTPTRER
jgi:uncharacterized protein DUF1499